MTNPATNQITKPQTTTTGWPANHHGDAALLYLDLMKRCLTRTVLDAELEPVQVRPGRGLRARLAAYHLQRTLDRGGLSLVRARAYDAERRRRGLDHPRNAETMIGLHRLDNIESCVRAVITEGVPGDLIETGVWRGGATIFMRAVLRAYGVTDRVVWAADSFAGLPKPDPDRYPSDEGDRHWTKTHLQVSLEEVRANFARYGLLDDQVRFLKGWFKDTLPAAPIQRLAVLRLDGDMYESTIQALHALYPKLSPGGFVIVDDYGEIPAAAQATEDFRAAHGITDPLEWIDQSGVFWRRSS